MTTTRNRHSESGYAAVLVAILVPVVFMGLAALSVDVARWYVEVQRIQKAADAAALAGVTHMPHDLTEATSDATDVSARNGYPNSGTTSVTVSPGTKPSELKVTVSSTIVNTFGRLIGVPTTTITRSAVTDYTGPAPMGSPCNTFGNEPPSNNGVSPTDPTKPKPAQPAGTALLPPLLGGFENCSSTPHFWATVEGPQTSKGMGDRYSTRTCDAVNEPSDGCNGSVNEEYNERGYYWALRVLPSAVNHPVSVQLYDPAYVNTFSNCGLIPDNIGNNPNPFTPDASVRYARSANQFCTGDLEPDVKYGLTTAPPPVVTSFALLGQTDTHNPMLAEPVQPDDCIKQFRGYGGNHSLDSGIQNRNVLTASVPGEYNESLAKVFHQWTELCTFTPTRAGDYYLQVRTNVELPGTGGEPNTGHWDPGIYKGNEAVVDASATRTVGRGNNSFGIRAVVDPLSSQPSSLNASVSVAGWERMPIYANAPQAATFNLIRVVPAARGKYVSFSFFDVGDASQDGSVKVLAPIDATGSNISATTKEIQGCTAPVGPVTGSLTGCKVNITQQGYTSSHNGKVQTISVPVPTDYACTESSQGGCWYRVKVNFDGGSVTDITTWDADVTGNPVRLIE